MCTRDRACLFGHVVNGQMHLNEIEFVVMPNHMHAIVVILGRGTACRAPTIEQFAKPSVGSIPTILRSYKSSVTRYVNLARGAPGTPVWQRNYFEHVVRNEVELNAIREYILGNPARWDDDENNPAFSEQEARS